MRNNLLVEKKVIEFRKGVYSVGDFVLVSTRGDNELQLNMVIFSNEHLIRVVDIKTKDVLTIYPRDIVNELVKIEKIENVNVNVKVLDKEKKEEPKPNMEAKQKIVNDINELLGLTVAMLAKEEEQKVKEAKKKLEDYKKSINKKKNELSTEGVSINDGNIVIPRGAVIIHGNTVTKANEDLLIQAIQKELKKELNKELNKNIVMGTI